MNEFYVYEIIDPRNNLPFYVGKGSKNRDTWHIEQIKKGYSTGNKYKDRIIKKLIDLGYEPKINRVYVTESESDAYNKEAELIRKYGRRNIDENGILTNVCKDNRPPLQKHSDEQREKFRQRMIGNTINTGRVQSKDERKKRSISLKETYASGRRRVTESTRKIISETHRGKHVDENTRRILSEKAKIAHKWRLGKTNEEIYGKEKAKSIAEKKKQHLPPNRKEITIDGITYESIKQASLDLGISEYKAKKRAQK